MSGGRRGASPALVVRGAADLRPRDLDAWRRVRQQMAGRPDSRRRQSRFRKDPAAYLAALEAHALQPSLPP